MTTDAGHNSERFKKNQAYLHSLVADLKTKINTIADGVVDIRFYTIVSF
jgi:hypothetical protein